MNPEDVTFVVCVEPGKYEVQAALMVESLRLFGGRFANAPVIAITPRVGPALAMRTRKRFEELGVVYLRRRHLHRAWQLFIGKVQALNDAEQIAATKGLVLVDCDILFVGEPSGLLLAPGAAVGACPSDQGIVGTTGASSQFDPAWRRACAAVGLTIEDLPWVDPSDGSEPVRFYVNSGVVVMRNGYDVPSRWLRCMDDLLSHHVAFPGWGPYFVDQIALGLAIARYAIPFQRLVYTHNFGVDSSVPDAWQSDELGQVRVLQHHDQLTPEHWGRTVERLRGVNPDLSALLAREGPIVAPPAPASAAAMRSVLRVSRGISRRAYKTRARLASREAFR